MLCHTPSHSTSFVSILWQPASSHTHTPCLVPNEPLFINVHTRTHTHLCCLADTKMSDLLYARASCLTNQDVQTELQTVEPGLAVNKIRSSSQSRQEKSSRGERLQSDPSSLIAVIFLASVGKKKKKGSCRHPPSSGQMSGELLRISMHNLT